MSYSSKFGGRAGKEKKSAPKPSAKKVKCPLCQQKGHDATKCPKNKEDLTPLPTSGGGAGSGIAHKTSRKASSSNNNKEQDDDNDDSILPPNNDNPYFVFDAGCDVGASMDGLAILFKVPEKKCISTYNTAVCSTTPLIYGGAICRQYIKANKPIWKKNAPRVNMMMEADPRLFFVIGLGHGFCEGDDDDDEDDDDDAMDALADALDDDDRVVGFCAKLDYAPDMIARTNVATQIRRLKTTCDIAMQEGVPIQIQVGSSSNSESSSSTSDESSGQILKDLATVLLDVIPQDDETPLQVHLSSWSGTSDTMLKLLKAFPDTLYIGMNPTVGFGKAATAHACAFDIPLDRILLETDNIIPAPISKSLGRKAFAHSGLVPYCAVAVADQKKIPPEDVARAASENTVRLYGRGIGRRAKEAVVEAAARVVVAQQQKQLLLAEEQEEEEAANNNKEQVETKQDQKKKKKKKQGGAAEAKQQDAERDLDDDILSSMLQESEIVP